MQCHNLTEIKIPRCNILCVHASKDQLKSKTLLHTLQLLQQKPCIYILYSNNTPMPDVYIGKTNNIKKRIQTHSKEKLFWKNIILFTATNMDIVNYGSLENHLIETVKNNRKCFLQNRLLPQNKPNKEIKKLIKVLEIVKTNVIKPITKLNIL
jgi:excinuclease UvrABC nuclease subunit